MLGGLVRGDVTFKLQHERPHRGRLHGAALSAYRTQHTPGEKWPGWRHPSMVYEHLSAALEEFGPFRGYWCLPWEAYIQILKRMFNMTNWKAAPLIQWQGIGPPKV